MDWLFCNWRGPFTPSALGTGEACVRDADGNKVADCGGLETRICAERRAVVIAAALTQFQAALIENDANGATGPVKGRVYADEQGSFHLEPGEYVKTLSGEFLARPPVPQFFIANLARHEVVEHEDGTITVSPSILITQPGVGQWHGYLEKGVWREA